MGSSLVSSRRAHLTTWFFGASLLVRRAFAFVPYGGRVDATLPIHLDRIDPVDPYDLTSALLGPNLFSTLYDHHPTLGPYPTLARALPTLEGGRTLVELRPGLRFASGAPLDARSVALSLERARTRLSFWGALPECRPRGSSTLEFATTQPSNLALVLAEPFFGIVPRDFRPESPDSSGAFRVRERARGRIVLARSALAPRGGSLLDEVRLTSGSLEEGLRAFESRESSLALGGLGLHHDRRDARPFTFRELGSLILRGGPGLGKFDRPGALHSALAEVDRGKLGPLGVRSRAATFVPRSLGGTLTVEETPLLRAVAEALASDLGSRPLPFPTDERSRRLAERTDPLALVFLRTPERESLRNAYLSRALTALDGGHGPSADATETPEKLARRSRLGLVGELSPVGGSDRKLRDGTETRHFSLDGASLYEERSRI